MHIQPNLPEIMQSEHNRNARLQDAEAHRLRTEAGLYDNEGSTRRQIVKIVVNGVKHLLQSLKSVPTPNEQNTEAEVSANA